jgi:hypothetical protein
MDAEWNMWVKMGVRKMVSADDMPAPTSHRGRQNYNSVFASQSNDAWSPSSPIGRASVLDSQFSLCEDSWDIATDDAFNQTGGDLIKRLGWKFPEGNQAVTNTPVSYWAIKTTAGKHAIVD